MSQTTIRNVAGTLRRRVTLIAGVLLLAQGMAWAGGRVCMCESLLGQLDAVKIPSELKLRAAYPEIIAGYRAGERRISALAFISDGGSLVVAEDGADKRGGVAGRVMVLNLTEAVPRMDGLLQAATDTVVSIAVSPDQDFYATGGARWDRSLVLWNTRGSEQQQVWQHKQPSDWWQKTLAFSNDGTHLVSATSDSKGPAQIWRMNSQDRTLDKFQVLPGPAWALSAAAFSPDGRFLAGGLGSGHHHPNDGRILVWNIEKQPAELVSEARVVSADSKESYDVTAAIFSADGRTLVTGDQHGTIRTWFIDEQGRLGSKLAIAAHPGKGMGVQSLARTRYGTVMSSGSDGTVKLWNVDSGKKLKSWDFEAGASTVLAPAPSGRHFAVGLANGAVYILRLQDGDRDQAKR